MNNKSNENNIFVNLDVLDEMIWTDAISNTNTLFLLNGRDDVFNVKSTIKYKNVTYFPRYEINDKFLTILNESKIKNIILLPAHNYKNLSIELINNGFIVAILNLTIAEVLSKNIDELTKLINNKTQSYYNYYFENLSRKKDIIANPQELEDELIDLISKLKFNHLNHIPFNIWLTQMIQLDNGCGEPLIYNLLKKALTNYTIKNGE